MDHKGTKRLPRITRRRFVKLAAAFGLLAGCSPRSAFASAAAPDAGRGAAGRVVRASHAGAWRDGALAPEALRQLLDAAVAELTGLDDGGEAWAALFDPGEHVAIKVNGIGGSFRAPLHTHVALATAIAGRLQDVGVPAKQIVIFDRYDRELEWCGYTINRNGSGVRCHGDRASGPMTRSAFQDDDGYVAGYRIAGQEIGLSKTLLDCDCLINVPILASHPTSGISFALKNHYGSFDRPADFHEEHTVRGLVELNALPEIRERTRLIIGDLLSSDAEAALAYDWSWRLLVGGQSILASFDPVAIDAVGVHLVMDAHGERGTPSLAETTGALASPWLQHAVEAGLGVGDPDAIEVADLELSPG